MVLLRHCSTWISHLYRPATSQLFKYQPLLPFLTRTFPSWFLRRVGELLPSKALHQHFYISDTVQEFAASVWAHQKQAHAEGKVSSSAVLGQGRDILSLLREYCPDDQHTTSLRS